VRALLSVVAVAAAGIGGALYARRAAAMAAPAGPAPAGPAPADSSLSDYLPPLLYPDVQDPGVFGGWLFELEDLVTDWEKRGEPYAAEVFAAAARHGVPGKLLLRVAYQECRFRTDIINGTTSSPVGAKGMFQFMPATAREMGIDPLNWRQAADGAARYLAQLRRQFGTWTLALRAYNWGPGNVGKYLKGQKSPPKETRDYAAQIGADVSLA